MVDAQSFDNVQFPRERFSKELLGELVDEVKNSHLLVADQTVGTQ